MGKKQTKAKSKQKSSRPSRSKAASREGEFVELYWEYGDPEAYYVYGHVDESAFRKALTVYYGEDFFYDAHDGDLKLRHAYVFHSREGVRDSGVDSFLRECPRRPGAFAVTVWDPPTPAERAKASIERLGARVMHRHIRLSRPSKDSPGDGTTWPWPFWQPPRGASIRDLERGADLEPISPAHKARYAPHTLTPSDAMELAGIADAYETLITHPARSVRETLHELHVAFELWSEGYLKDESPTPAPATPATLWPPSVVQYVRHRVTVESVARSSSRAAKCVCGWEGPERATFELVFDDAIQHESSGKVGVHLGPTNDASTSEVCS